MVDPMMRLLLFLLSMVAGAAIMNEVFKRFWSEPVETSSASGNPL